MMKSIKNDQKTLKTLTVDLGNDPNQRKALSKYVKLFTLVEEIKVNFHG